jgi:hypothetical protein
MTASTPATSYRGCNSRRPSNHPVASVQGFAPVLPGNKVPSKTAEPTRVTSFTLDSRSDGNLVLARGHVASDATARGSSKVPTNTADVILRPVSVNALRCCKMLSAPPAVAVDSDAVSVGVGTGTALLSASLR